MCKTNASQSMSGLLVSCVIAQIICAATSSCVSADIVISGVVKTLSNVPYSMDFIKDKARANGSSADNLTVEDVNRRFNVYVSYGRSGNIKEAQGTFDIKDGKYSVVIKSDDISDDAMAVVELRISVERNVLAGLRIETVSLYNIALETQSVNVVMPIPDRQCVNHKELPSCGTHYFIHRGRSYGSRNSRRR